MAKKILIADDQKFSLQMLRDALIAHGFKVFEAADGASACRQAEEILPDLILMDMIMPGLDGVEACRRIKQNRATSAIPIIMLTANKDKERLVAAFKAGADDYVNKPFASYELLARINSNLLKHEAVNVLRQKIADSEILLEIAQAVTSTLDTREILQSIVAKIAATLGVKRCSITMVRENDQYGYVLASSDNPEISDLRIELARYPEIQEVVRTGQTLILEDAKHHPLMETVRERISRLDIDTLLVLPVIYRSEVIGTLMMRTARKRESFSSRELNFCKLVASVSASALKNAHLYEQVRDESLELRQVKEQLEAELKEKNLLASLFEHASEGLMALDVRGDVVYVNQSALELLGYQRAEAPQINLTDFLAEESFQEIMENHMNFFLGCDYRSKYDLLFRTRSGDKRCVSVSVSDYRLAGNYAILSFRDVTEERLAQQQLKEANDQLKGLDQLKSDFISTATHDLRTPVTIISSYCSLLQETGSDNLTAEQQQFLAAAIENSEHLLKLIDDMLDIARLDAGKEGFNFTRADIIEPVQEAYALLAPFAELQGLEFTINIEVAAAPIICDPLQIRSVLTNLVGNAIKFTPRGGKIGITVCANADEVHVSVHDTGIGIPEQHKHEIFDEFFQIQHPDSGQRGSGLGLSICKRIVSAHSGKMWVDSTPREGSSFTFALPRAPE